MALRILCVTPWFPNSPTDPYYNFIFHSVSALGNLGHEVTVAVTRPWTPRIFGLLHKDWDRLSLQVQQFDPSLDIHVTHYLSFPRYLGGELTGPLYRLGTGAVLSKIIREKSIQVIHSHTEVPGQGAVALGRRLGVPVVITLHGINTSRWQLNTPRKRERLRNTLSSADRVVLVGHSLWAHFAPLAGRDDHFRLVPNGFHLPNRLGGAQDRKWDDSVRFISVSNLHEGKGIDLSLHALARPKGEGITNWSYQIIGDGRERQSLEELSAKLRLVEKVEFKGVLSHNATQAALTEADVFILPSYREAFGVAYVEAMAAGLLAIGVAGQGPEAFIRHEETGLLVRPRDVESIVSTLRSVIHGKERMRRIALTGRDFVWREFTWAHHAQRLTAVYEEVALKDRASGEDGGITHIH